MADRTSRVTTYRILALATLVAAAPLALAAPGRKPVKPEVFRPNAPRQTLSQSWEIAEREYLGTPATERAVERALAFLAKEQNPDLQARFQILEGILRPSAQTSGERFQRYQPGLPAVAPDKENIKEEPKEKAEPKGKEPNAP